MISGTAVISEAGARIPSALLSSAAPAPELDSPAYKVPDQFAADRVPASTPAKPQDQESKPDRETLKKAVEQLNQVAQELGHRLAFGLYDGTGEFYSKVIDRRTNEIVKLIPSKDLLEFHRKLQEAVGAIVDATA